MSTPPFVDERLVGWCVFCGGDPDTKDHVPPKAFLDKPYPANLLTVGACEACNGGAALDEQFVTCLLEVAVCGTVDPTKLRRASVSRALRQNQRLAAQLASDLRPGIGVALTESSRARLTRVLEKIGRALWAYQTMEPTEPLEAEVRFAPICTLSSEQTDAFFATVNELLPEVGSRMFNDIWEGRPTGWKTVQEGRFSYSVAVLRDRGRIKMIIGDYLAVEVDLV